MRKIDMLEWAEALAVRLREQMGLAPTSSLSPDRLAAHLGFEVWTPFTVPELEPKVLTVLRYSNQAASWNSVFIKSNGRNLVILNTYFDRQEQLFNLMLEITLRLIAQRPWRRDILENGSLSLSTYNSEQEIYARMIALILLVPRTILEQIAHSGDIFSYAAEYGLTREQILERMEQGF